ncbi:MAG: hypothetical protein IPM52_13010 [Bacteroidetes bacterium]|nr:hypothetical protein [Bacteroidota bacterium]
MKINKIFLLLLVLITQKSFGQDLEQVIKAKPLSWSGAIGTSLASQPKRGKQPEGSPLNYSVFGNLKLSIFETVDLPLSFSYSRFGFNVEKPLYQFGLTPTYKWLKLHLGHSAMHFNNYTLSGHTFFGAGVELNPKKLRFAAMTGRLRSPVLIDALTGQAMENPQFERLGWGVKLGLGSQSNFVDLMLFKASDRIESIPNWQDSVYQQTISGLTGKFAPQENLLAGLTTRLTFFRQIVLNIEAGGSLFTSDQSSKALLENVPLFTPRLSTTLKWAGKASLSFPVGPFQLETVYERIQPDYFSLGTYQIVNDQENITVSPTGSLFKGKFSFTGMFGTNRNNLMGNRSETTRRIIINTNAIIAPRPHYGLNLGYSNFAFRQQAQAIVLNDSVLIRQVNRSLTIMPYYNILSDTSRQHAINAAFIRQQVDDLNPVTRKFGNMLTTMYSGNYTLTLNKGFNFSAGLNHTTLSSPLLENRLTGLSLGAGKNFKPSGINLSFNTNFSNSSVDGNSDGMVVNAGFVANMKLKKRHEFRTNLHYLRTTSKQFDSFSDLVFQMGYTLRLN